MTKEEFIKIFAEYGIDSEWAEICWGRVPHKDMITEAEVREAAQSWADYADDGGF